MKKHKRILAILGSILLVTAVFVGPEKGYAVTFNDAQLQSASDADFGGPDVGVVGTAGGVYSPIATPTGPGPQAPKTIPRPAATSATVNDQAGLQAELNNGTEHITIGTSFALTGSLTINNATDYQVLIDGPGVPITLTAATGQRHFNIAATGALHLTFDQIFLEGNGIGGGIHASGTATINNPEIDNCFLSATNEGGGIYATGVVRIEGGHITNNRAARGGGIMNAENQSLTVVGTEVRGNQANYTATLGSGFAGGIGSGQGGSLLVESCIVDGNKNTGDTNESKGLAGGIGGWEQTYVNVVNSTVTHNIAGNFGAGILAHWNSTLIVDGGLIDHNDASASPSFGNGGGVYAAAGTNLTLTNNVSITNNLAKYGGGGRAEYNNTIHFDNGTAFRGNTASSSGGGFSFGGSTLLGSSTVTIGAAIVEGNTANFGGGFNIGRGFAVNATGIQLLNNIGLTSGGATYIHPQNTVTFNNSVMSGGSADYGGGVYLGSAANAGTATTLNLNDSAINNNSAALPTVDGQGGAICSGNFHHINLNRTVIDGNKGDYGGAIIAFNDTVLNIDDTRISNNMANLSGGGIYLLNRAVANMTSHTQIASNHTENSGGGIYMSSSTEVHLNNTTSIHGNTAVGYGGGVAGSQARSVTLHDTATINNNSAGEFGGGIYAHTGAVAGTDTLITLGGNSVVNGNTASNGGGISGGSLDMPSNIPTISIEGNAQITNNESTGDGGGIWVPQSYLNKITAASTSAFSGNKSAQSYYMLDTAPEVAIHETHILTTNFTTPPNGAPAFTYAYNNDDIVYQDGNPLVTVTFDATGGMPEMMQVSTMQGDSLATTMPPIPVRDGYTFLGWYTQSNGMGTQFDKDTLIDHDITVYAHWEALPPAPPTPVPPLNPVTPTNPGSANPRTEDETNLLGLNVLWMAGLYGLYRVVSKRKTIK